MKANEEVLETVVLCSLQQDSFHSVLVYISHVYIYIKITKKAFYYI